ncbi:MAG: phycobiliprotein lyase [Geitlerinemataceae cyanobacterium]
MTVALDRIQTSVSQLACRFFERSAGRWLSQRRYYTLNVHEPQELESAIEIDLLPAGHPELVKLARAHDLEDDAMLLGTTIRWESRYLNVTRKPAIGSTVIGIGTGELLYRDRSFSSPKPVTAELTFANPDTMRLLTVAGNSSFEEEIKLVGTKHRTRQTIASRAGEEVLIGQYLETRTA